MYFNELINEISFLFTEINNKLNRLFVLGIRASYTNYNIKFEIKPSFCIKNVNVKVSLQNIALTIIFVL